MKSLLFLSLLIITDAAIAQFGRIEDKDGYVNIRKNPDLKSEVVGKFVADDIFWCLESSEGEWLEVDIQTPPYHGHIHKSRVKFIREFYKMAVDHKGQNKLSFGRDTFKVEIKTRSFEPTKNKISDLANINEKTSWGNFGTMPKQEYEYIKLINRGKTFMLPAEAIENLFEPDLDRTFVNFDKPTNTLYIHATNSDGAGDYVVLWKIKDGRFAGRTTAIPF